MGRREEALQAVEEAVELHRTLAEARSDAFLPELVGNLREAAQLSQHAAEIVETHRQVGQEGVGPPKRL